VCFKCYVKASSQKKPIKECLDYGHTTGSVFFSTVGGEVLFYGLEWEVENGHYPQDYDRVDRSFAEELWHFKECVRKKDGSVSMGHEMCTLPLTLDYHKRFFHWDKMTELHERHGFKGHDSLKAGIHVHASKAYFGLRDSPSQKKKLAALVYLMDRKDWRDNWKKFSRRGCKAVMDAIADRRFGGSSNPWGYCKFFDIDYSINTLVEGLTIAINMSQGDRNHTLNFYNYEGGRQVLAKTVEWRGNKSTTEWKTIIAILEMYDVIIKIACGKMTEAQLRAMTWKQMCKRVPNTHDCLVSYLKAKRLWME